MFKLRKRVTVSLAVITVLLMSVVGCLSVMIDGPKDSWEGVVRHIKPSTVQLIIGDINPVTESSYMTASGSGFVITEDGLIVTASHMIEGMENMYKPWIEVRFSNGASYLAKWARGAPEHDVAVIKIDANNLPILKFETRPLVEGSPILAMGSNHVSSWAVTDGIISKLEAQYNLKIGHGWLQMTTTINRGYSGGPVVNARGKVVGIIVAGYIYLNETYLAAPGSSAVKVIDDLLSGKSNKEKGFEKIQIVF